MISSKKANIHLRNKDSILKKAFAKNVPFIKKYKTNTTNPTINDLLTIKLA